MTDLPKFSTKVTTLHIIYLLAGNLNVFVPREMFTGILPGFDSKNNIQREVARARIYFHKNDLQIISEPGGYRCVYGPPKIRRILQVQEKVKDVNKEDIFLSDTQLRVLLFLRIETTAREMANSFGIKKQSSFVYFSQLDKRGLIEKRRAVVVEDGEKRNGKVYWLSEKGKKLLSSGRFEAQIQSLKDRGLLAG